MVRRIVAVVTSAALVVLVSGCGTGEKSKSPEPAAGGEHPASTETPKDAEHPKSSEHPEHPK